ncbi:hypothetical protein AwPolaro_10320 [Polaromonas sp.]|nr:hypothetical protein AwPolaro_10320 [Polaromonas sp.]
MINLFRRLFFKPAAINPNATSDTEHLSTIEDGTDNAMRQQLILVLFRDLIRRQGIPPAWIDLQILVFTNVSRDDDFYVQLILKHWDTRLINYAQVFQNELMANIARFEPRFDTWMRGISWQLKMTDSCPYTKLPSSSAFWRAPPEPPPVISRPPAEKLKKPAPAAPSDELSDSEAAEADIHQLFLIRDQELRDAATQYAPVDYEKPPPRPPGQ